MRPPNSWRGMRSASQSEGPISSVGCGVSMERSRFPAARDAERRLLARENLGAVRGDHHRLAAQEITGLRQVLVGMDHEQYVGFEHPRIFQAANVSWDR